MTSHSKDFNPYISHKQIVRKVAKENGIPYQRAFYIINAYISFVKANIIRGNDISIVGFGTFKKTNHTKFMDKRIRKAKNIKIGLRK